MRASQYVYVELGIEPAFANFNFDAEIYYLLNSPL